MERRSYRYDTTQILPKRLRKVTISWGANSSIESEVINFSALGMKVIFHPIQDQIDFPKKNETVKIKFPIIQVWLTGLCIYCTDEPDGSYSVGIYFCVPAEQNNLSKLLSKRLNIPLHESSFVCHEWEELVEKLCNSEDLKLKNIGFHEKRYLGHN
jgi:hypothetical protein